MEKYHKIETIYERDIFGTKKLIKGQYRNETVKFLKDSLWFWTEKVDGTNIRIYWDGHSISIAGRTERSEIPTELKLKLDAMFLNITAEEMFEQLFGDKEVMLFGEGFGKKIQKVGDKYIPDGVDFILFDVSVNGNFLNRFAVEDIAKAFDIKVVPMVGSGTLDEAVNYVMSNPHSTIGDCDMEGIVCRPAVELRDHKGERVIVKIKWEDMKDII